jgi:hypothetical protein
MDGVFTLWNVLKMVKTIDIRLKSLYLLKIGTAENSLLQCDGDLIRWGSLSRTGMNFLYAPTNRC